MSAPTHYICSKCAAKGVRLWRQYSMFLSGIELKCRICACKDQEIDPKSEKGNLTRSDQIGWMIPAVPDLFPDPTTFELPKDYTFWGYSSVPDEGVKWWYGLI